LYHSARGNSRKELPVPERQLYEGLDVRSLRVGEPGDTVRRAPDPANPSESRFARPPSARRGDEERARRHRERAIAAWLRDLAR
jgi:hypothetical protein